MQKTILITGSTDGIGLETATSMAAMGHRILLHGRNPAKLEQAKAAVSAASPDNQVAGYVADLSTMAEVEALATAVSAEQASLDVLINNAGVLSAPVTTTADGLDVRFAVNTIAPYLLTQRLLPLMGPGSRVVNISSAAQAPVDLAALGGKRALSDMEAYSQSKLAITMWSRDMGLRLAENGPLVVSVNPGSLLATKMVKDGFGVAGSDIAIGADILARAALSEEFDDAAGAYFDNDAGRFGQPHRDALDDGKVQSVVAAIEEIIAGLATG